MTNEKELDSLEDSALFIGTLAVVAIVASAVLAASVWFGVPSGASK
ncbi:hypothetical protein [Thiomonas sp.]